MKFANFITEKDAPIEQWFHGTSVNFDKFTDEFVGTGHDQEGPGIYFTSNEEDATGYSRKSDSHGALFIVNLNFNKAVPTNKKAKVSEIGQLIEWASNYQEILGNWDENPKVAMKTAMSSILREASCHESFKSVWYEFYRHEPVEFVRNLVMLGYDGVIVKKEFMNAYHAIVYNPKAINIVDKVEY